MTDLHRVDVDQEIEVTEADIQETDCDFAATVFRALIAGDEQKMTCYACQSKWEVANGKIFFKGTCLSWRRGAPTKN